MCASVYLDYANKSFAVFVQKLNQNISFKLIYLPSTEYNV